MHKDTILIPKPPLRFLIFYFLGFLGFIYSCLLLCAAYMLPRIEPSYPVYINPNTAKISEIFLVLVLIGLAAFCFGLFKLIRLSGGAEFQARLILISVPFFLLICGLAAFFGLARILVAFGIFYS